MKLELQVIVGNELIAKSCSFYLNLKVGILATLHKNRAHKIGLLFFEKKTFTFFEKKTFQI